MIDAIIRFSTHNRIVVLVLTAVAALVGWLSFEALPIDAVPDITNVQVQVNTAVEGLAPEEIERLITFPVETAMSGIAGVSQVRSITRFGLSQVTVAFEDRTNIYRARQLVSERLSTVSGRLPGGARPELGPVSTGLGEIFFYTVEARTPAAGPERVRQLMELKALQEWSIKPRLLDVKGVTEVNTIGGYEKQYHVQPKPALMARYGIHFDDLEEALSRSNQNAGGGYVEQTAEQFLVQAVGLFRGVADIRAVPVKTLENLRTISVGDVADVELGSELRTGAALVDGREAVLGSALMLMGENSRAVAQRVGKRIDELRGSLPEGVLLKTLYDRSTLVNATLATVRHNLLTGALLVVIVLLALLGNARAALITAVTIPVSFLFACAAMLKLGISGNLMSLGALDFGIIVDGTVIVLDNCVRVVAERARERGRPLSRPEIQDAVAAAAIEIRGAAGFGELIILAVFLPLLALVGIEGKMFRPMAATLSLALVGALALSFTAAPALASALLSGDPKAREPWLMSRLRALYAPVLDLCLRRGKWIAGLGAGAVALGAGLFLRLGGEFLPQLDEGSLMFQFVRPVNISLTQSVALQERSERLLAEFPESAGVFSRIGTAEVATDPMGVNLSDTFVMLKDRGGWPARDGRRRSKDELADAMLERLESELPGQRVLLSQPIQMRFNELLEGTRSDVVVKVLGEDMEVLSGLARRIAEVVEKVRGAGDVEVELKGGSPILRIAPKEGILRDLGVSSREVLDTIGIALGGREVGHLYEGVRRFPIVIRLKSTERADLGAIRELPVGSGTNATIPLGEAADIGFAESYGSISREQAKLRAAVLINPRGRDMAGFVAEARAAVEAKVPVPAGVFVEWGGNFRNLQEARRRLLYLAPVALALVLMMTYVAFKDAAQTFLVFSGVPLALVGGVLGLLANGLHYSISAAVGFVALTGIAVLNGIVLVHQFNDLAKTGLRGAELVKEGSLRRLRPVLMTALVEVFGFLPMMLSSGVGAEVQRPLASVVVGGVISSTALTLLVLPVLYAWIERRKAARR